MITKNSILDRLTKLEVLGYAKVSDGRQWSLIGRELCKLGLEVGTFILCEKGFVLCIDDLMDEIPFSVVSKIASHLRVELFSEASKTRIVDFYLPLDIECLNATVVVGVPFLAYSRFLGVLMDSWRASGGG
jgi:hypothetical protein